MASTSAWVLSLSSSFRASRTLSCNYWCSMRRLNSKFVARKCSLAKFVPVSRGVLTPAITCGTDNTVTISGRSFVSNTSRSRTSTCRETKQPAMFFSATRPKTKDDEITVHYLNRDGETLTVQTKTGQNLLDIALDNDLDIDGFGACEGTLACSTCHLIFNEEIYETLPEKLDEEEDMLDLAYGLTDTSRLGCQICVTKEMDGMVVQVPEGVADARDV